MESIIAAMFFLAPIQYTLGNLVTHLLLVFIKTKPDIDLVDGKNEARYLAYHYPVTTKRR